MKIIVSYWAGTTQLDEVVTTYEDALRVAGRNQNAYGPTFWDEDGNQLHDDGFGLAYEDQGDTRLYAVAFE